MKDWELDCLFHAESLARKGYIDSLLVKDVTLQLIRQHPNYKDSDKDVHKIESILPPGPDDPIKGI